MPKFNEDNTTEQMLLTTLQRNGWEYIPAEELDRDESDVMVESMVRAALIRLNPEIAEDESRADEVIYKLRTLFLSTNAQNLVTQNEAFKELVFEKNSYPFGENGRQVSIDLFGTEPNGKLDQNQYVVTNQWVYPKKKGGKRLDIVLLVNGFPFAIGELKVRAHHVGRRAGHQQVRAEHPADVCEQCVQLCHRRPLLPLWLRLHACGQVWPLAYQRG
ncbi:MAG: type I restriction endonuclease [Clostridium sp.]